MDGGSGGERNVISFRTGVVGEREMLLVSPTGVVQRNVIVSLSPMDGGSGGERNVISFRMDGGSGGERNVISFRMEDGRG